MTEKFSLKKGEVLFDEGNYSDCAFIIESGRLEVSKLSKNGKKKIIGLLGESDIVGEMGLIDGGPRSATVTALRDTQGSVITKKQFQCLAQNNPRVLIPLLKILSNRLRNALEAIKKLSPKSESSTE